MVDGDEIRHLHRPRTLKLKIVRYRRERTRLDYCGVVNPQLDERNPAPGSGPALAWSAGLDRCQPSRMSRGTGTSGSRTCSWQSSTGWPKMPSALGVQAQSRSGTRARGFGPVEQPDGDRLEQDLARAP